VGGTDRLVLLYDYSKLVQYYAYSLVVGGAVVGGTDRLVLVHRLIGEIGGGGMMVLAGP
jgi:hypothetical protein